MFWLLSWYKFTRSSGKLAKRVKLLRCIKTHGQVPNAYLMCTLYINACFVHEGFWLDECLVHAWCLLIPWNLLDVCVVFLPCAFCLLALRLLHCDKNCRLLTSWQCRDNLRVATGVALPSARCLVSSSEQVRAEPWRRPGSLANLNRMYTACVLVYGVQAGT